MGDNCPWLLISSCSQNQILYDVAKNRCYDAINSPELERTRVLASSCSHGWLVLTENVIDECCLWNPKSREEIQLPPLQELLMYDAAVLSKAPTEPDCHIIFNSRFREKQAYCKIGDAAFKIRDWGLHAVIRSSRGRIYGVLRYSLVSLELVQEEVEVRPIFELEGTEEWSDADYLVESDDDNELLLLRMVQPTLGLVHCREFRVFRLHTERMECVEVGSVGDRTLFVADYGDALCCSSSANKTKANAVYYTRDGCRSLYIYSLDDGSTTTVLPPSPGHLYYATWIWIDSTATRDFIIAPRYMNERISL